MRSSLAWIGLGIVLVLGLVAWLLFAGPGVAVVGVGTASSAPVPRIEAIRALADAPQAPERAVAIETVAVENSAPADSVRCLVVTFDGQPRVNVPVFLWQARAEVGAKFEGVDDERELFLGERKTSAEGRVEFPLATRERVYALALVEKEGVFDRAWVGDAREITLRFARPTAGGFEVEVVTEAGIPVTEYTLTLYRTREDSMTSIGEHAVSSPDGRFRAPIESKLPSNSELFVGVRPPAEFEPASATFARDQLFTETMHRIVVREKVGGLRGLVVGPDGQPVPDAAVIWTPTREPGDGVWARTDPSGAFVLGPKVVAGTGFLSAEDWQFAPYLGALADVPITSAGELRVELEPGCVVEGRVTRDGIAVPNAYLVARVADRRPEVLGRLTSHFTANTDDDGRYRMLHVPLGTIHVSIDSRPLKERRGSLRSNGYALDVVEAVQNHDIAIVSGVRVRGEFDIDLNKRASLFLQIFDASERSVPWSTGNCGVEESFELEAPRARDSILRVWFTADAMIDIPIPASSEAIDLGEIELRTKQFHALDAK